MKIQEITDNVMYLLLDCDKYEKKLIRYQGYKQKSIIKWKQQTGLNWRLTKKLLEKIVIFDSQAIRELVSEIVRKNIGIFDQENCYLASFGEDGKSGSIILYEFAHSGIRRNLQIKKSWDLCRLPEYSTIVFVDDIIGTGWQSVEYINTKLNYVLNPSFNPIILCLCATPEGLNYVKSNTNFNVMCGLMLNEEDYQHYSENCNYFCRNEKDKLMDLSEKLKDPKKEDFDRGLLLAFYFSIPNNSMPFLWKNKYKYRDNNGLEKEWLALLPRYF